MKPSIVSPLLLACVGVLFVLAGPGLGVGISSIAGKDIARIKRLEPVTVAGLRGGMVGGEVLLEGRISANMPAQFRDYVAYIHEVDTNTRVGKEDWDEVERVTPPLVIDLADGTVRIENSTYNFGIMSTTTAGNDKYRGVKAGDPVVVLGVLNANDDTVNITADTLAPGTVASYLKIAGQFQMIFVIMGSIFGLIGLVMIVGGARALVRGQRTVRLPARRISTR